MRVTIKGEDVTQQVQDWLRERDDQVTSSGGDCHPLYGIEPGQTIPSDEGDWSIFMVDSRTIVVCSASEAGKARLDTGPGWDSQPACLACRGVKSFSQSTVYELADGEVTPTDELGPKREVPLAHSCGLYELGDLTFAEELLLELNSECYGVELEPDKDGIVMLNEERVPRDHTFAVLDVEGETMATGASRSAAIEAACLREVRWHVKHGEKLEARVRRVFDALRVIQSVGNE